MRLKPEQIDVLAQKVAEGLRGQEGVELRAQGETLLAEIRKVIVQDLKDEEALEAEARKLLDEHREQIKLRGGNYDEMLRMTVKRLARERKVVL